MSSIQNHWRYKHILATLQDALNLQRRSLSGRSLGDAIANIIAYGIVSQVSRGKDPDGGRLPPLNSKYLAWKVAHGFNPAILHKTDHMMNFQQVKGIVVISKDAMTMFYGLDPWAQQKAEYAHEGKQGRSARPGLAQIFQHWARPPRPFYEINDQLDYKIQRWCDLEIDDLIMSLGARRK